MERKNCYPFGPCYESFFPPSPASHNARLAWSICSGKVAVNLSNLEITSAESCVEFCRGIGVDGIDSSAIKNALHSFCCASFSAGTSI